MRTLILLLFAFSAQQAFPDGNEDSLKNICKKNHAIFQRCCQEGHCVTKDALGEDSFALTVGPQKIRQFRNLCFLSQNLKAPQCPEGKHIREIDTLYTDKDPDTKLSTNCNPHTLTRLIELSSEKDFETPNTTLLKELQTFCLEEKEYLQKTDCPFEGDLNSETPQAVILENLKSETCPMVQSWNGYFEKKHYSKIFSKSRAHKKKFDELIDAQWGKDLSKSDRDKLFTNECLHVTTLRKKLVPGVPCDGMLHYKVSDQVPQNNPASTK